MLPLPVIEAEIDGFLADFESCALPKERWTHAAHIFTGACCVHRLGEDMAIDHMRVAIRRYNEAVGGKNTATNGYHETVTIFWIKLLAAFRANEPRLSRAEFAARAVQAFEHRRDLFVDFYDFDLVASTEARLAWIPPGLKTIEPANL